MLSTRNQNDAHCTVQFPTRTTSRYSRCFLIPSSLWYVRMICLPLFGCQVEESRTFLGCLDNYILNLEIRPNHNHLSWATLCCPRARVCNIKCWRVRRVCNAAWCHICLLLSRALHRRATIWLGMPVPLVTAGSNQGQTHHSTVFSWHCNMPYRNE